MRDILDLILTGLLVLFAVLGVIICVIMGSIIFLPFMLLNWLFSIPFKLFNKEREREKITWLNENKDIFK